MPRPRPQRLVIGLLLAGIVARLLPHPPNVTPVTAIALFGGAVLSTPLALWLPLAIMVVSDVIIGLHDVILFTWAGFLLVSFLGMWACLPPAVPSGQVGRQAGRKLSVRRLCLASVSGSTLFFLLTNFGVWLFGEGGRMYPSTLEGLRQCYLAAIPFYRNALLGDAGWTAALFGLYALATSRQPLQHPIHSS